jgi:hypothetical protein
VEIVRQRIFKRALTMKNVSDIAVVDLVKIRDRAVEDLKAGKSLLGPDGALTPLAEHLERAYVPPDPNEANEANDLE